MPPREGVRLPKKPFRVNRCAKCRSSMNAVVVAQGHSALMCHVLHSDVVVVLPPHRSGSARCTHALDLALLCAPALRASGPPSAWAAITRCGVSQGTARAREVHAHLATQEDAATAPSAGGEQMLFSLCAYQICRASVEAIKCSLASCMQRASAHERAVCVRGCRGRRCEYHVYGCGAALD
jgi:CMP-2-keto-3-deoxyoctulosonic acid synthetase